MRKIASLFMTVVLLVICAGCGNKEVDSGTGLQGFQDASDVSKPVMSESAAESKEGLVSSDASPSAEENSSMAEESPAVAEEESREAYEDDTGESKDTVSEDSNAVLPGAYADDSGDWMYFYPNGIGVIYQFEDDGSVTMSGTMITGNAMEIENVETPCGFEDGKLIFSYRDRSYEMEYIPDVEMVLGASYLGEAENLTNSYANDDGMTMTLNSDGTGTFADETGERAVFWGYDHHDNKPAPFLIFGSYLTGVEKIEGEYHFYIDADHEIIMRAVTEAGENTGEDGSRMFSMIQPDETWEPNEDDPDHVDFVKYEGGFARIDASYISKLIKKPTIDDLYSICDGFLDRFLQEAPDVVLGDVEYEECQFAGMTGGRIEYSFSSEGNDFVQCQVVFVDDVNLFQAYLFTMAENYDENFAAFEKTLNSFRYTGSKYRE